jgi:glycosyltransferase involved in cell wall biosynthesis
MDSVYAALDLSVLTSKSEGLSITLLESMAQGLPVVVTAVGGNPGVVVHGETGFLVPPADVQSFADAVIRLCREPETRARMGVAARKRCEDRYDIRRVSPRYEASYESLLGWADADD